MNVLFLFIALMLVFTVVIIGTTQRIFQIPEWFSNPPVSFELLKSESKRVKSFWIPLSILFIVSACTSIILNWQYTDVRNYAIAGLACYAITRVLSAAYFVREIAAFSKMPADALPTRELLHRTKTWLRLTTTRDVLQLLAAIFITIAFYNLLT